jgi:type IV pilus assembly protein PilV
MPLRSAHRFAGFSLLELTVAMAVFSMGMGGFSLILLASMQGTAEARYQTAAALHAESLAEMIVLNSDAVGHYVNPVAPPPGDCLGAGADCGPDAIAAAYLDAWGKGIGADLPEGTGLVCLDSNPEDGTAATPACDGGGGPVVKVFWQEPRRPDAEGDGQRRAVVRLPLP